MAELQRTAGYGTIIALSIGSLIGSGLFFGPAIGAGIAGPASILAWLLLSVMSLYIGTCFGELVAMFPKAGGVYEYGKQTYGRFFSFIIGWLSWLVGNISIVVMVIAGIDYLLPGQNLMIFKVILSIFFLALLNYITLRGMEGSSAMVMIFTGITIAVILAIIIPGLFRIQPGNFSPFLVGGAASIFVTMFFIAESFFGWEAAAFLSEETKDPEKVIPKSLMISTVIVGVLIILTVGTMIGIMPSTDLASSTAPFTDSAETIFAPLVGSNLPIAIDLISLGVYLTMLGCAAGAVITMPRLLLALARDKLFLQQFTAIHPKFATPHKAIYFQFFVSVIILFMALGNYETLLSMLVPLGFTMYATTLLAVPILRRKRPDINRVFKAPFGDFMPYVIVAIYAALIVLWVMNVEGSLAILGMGLSLIFIGIPLYFLIELYNDPNMIRDTNDVLANLTLLTEGMNVPKSIQKEVLSHLGDIKGADILEFGCGVGTLTTTLAKEVGPKGTIYATSFSPNQMEISRRRIENQKWLSDTRSHGKVVFVHDEEHHSRIHPEVGHVDVAVSIGMIGYVQDIKTVLRDINSRLPENGRICFVDYGDFFHVLPNVDWLEKNDTIEQLFRECGFSVQVKRKPGILWNHIFIYGMKSKKNVLFI